MNTSKKTLCLLLLSGCLGAISANGQTMIESFEYASDADLQQAWSASGATISLSNSVATHATGAKSLRVDADFSAIAWATATLSGPTLTTPLSIEATQYITVRIAGDARFTNAVWQQFYIYAYDAAGNFGRWGSPIPTTNNWQILNFLASGMEQPWDSTGLPDLNGIVQFKFFVFGQGATPGTEFSATILVDELMVRNSPLIEVTSTSGPATIENFESYASDADLLANWSPQSATLSLSSYVAAHSTGTNSMRVDRFFPANAWETEVMTGPARAIPMSIAPTQYLTIRVAGDPAFTNASYQTLFIYAYDVANNFGRWGSEVPIETNWQVFNYLASSISQPWDSPALPDLNNIVRFKLYLYGQGSPAGPEFQATIYIDDLMVRDTPLTEFPPASPMRSLIDDFEGYADDTALHGFYSYLNSPAATVTTAAIETPAPQGSKALKLGIDFAAGQYPWGAVNSGTVAPFSFPTNAVVQCRFKGDSVLAPTADDGTVFWLSFFDKAQRRFTFSTLAPAVSSSEWTTVKAAYSDFWANSPVDTGNLVGWQFLVEGWQGTADSTALSGAFYIDDVRITIAPVLSVVKEAGGLKLHMDDLMPGTTYTLRQTTDFSQWNTTTIQATSTSQTWDIPAGQKGFYQLYYTP
jgi:hypothetical protein